MKLLLDTHLLLWAAGSPDLLPATARPLLEDAQNELLFSAPVFGRLPSKEASGVPISSLMRGCCNGDC